MLQNVSIRNIYVDHKPKRIVHGAAKTPHLLDTVLETKLSSHLQGHAAGCFFLYVICTSDQPLLGFAVLKALWGMVFLNYITDFYDCPSKHYLEYVITSSNIVATATWLTF